MGVVKWLGDSEHWCAEPCDGPPLFLMALTERWVLDVATAESAARKLSLAAGLNCTSRLALRVALASSGLNPLWWPLPWHGPCVAKAPASSANLGVRFLHPSEYVENLQAVAPDLARFGVIEEFVDGPQYEVDGYVVSGEVKLFHPLLQQWNEDGDRIVGYERSVPRWEDWKQAVRRTVHAVGLNDAPFCVEMRHSIRDDAWKVIEIHARLGEDPDLASLISDENPVAVIERACRSSSRFR
jgi:hypothetical protein